MHDSQKDFAEFVRARQDTLVRFGYLLTGDRMAGEDLAQIGLAKLYLKWNTIREAGSMEAWVRRVMVNEHTTWWRRAWRKRETLDFDPAREADHRGVTDAHVDRELWAQVMTLPPRQRAAIALRFYEDLTEAQTADILGCSIGTVKSQTHRALATLRTRVQEVPA